MRLREEILKEHSKHQTNRIIKWIGNDQKKFDELVSLFLKGEYRVTQRAGWPLSYIAVEHPQLIKKHLKKLLLNLSNTDLHPAVIRNTVRLLQFIHIPSDLQGLCTDTCFRLLNDKKQPIAIRVFSMTVLGNCCMEYPELKQELQLSIEAQLPYSTSGFRSRARKVMNQISNLP